MPKTTIPFETLIADLHGSDWTRRCDAARLLGQSRDPRAVAALLPDLKDPDWKVRRNAVQALGALKSTEAVPGLLEALHDRVATVRERAAVALGRIKDPQTLPALIEAVIEEKGSGFHVNEGAYQAVRKFGKKAGPILMERLKSKPNIHLLELLADAKYDAAADVFITLAESRDPALRRAALSALGKSGDARAMDYLMRILAGDDLEAQTLAVQSLGRLGAAQAAASLLDLLQDDQLFGPRVGLYHAVRDAFQEFSGIRREVEGAFPVNSKLAFGMGGAGTTLPEMIGMLGSDGFQKLNQMLTEAESRTAELGEKFNLPPGAGQTIADLTWKFGALFADARDTKTEQVQLLIRLLKSENSLARAAAALSLPWYLDAQALSPLEQASREADDMARRASAWAYAALKNMLP